ncbi:MAG: hypothetical protein LUD47_07675 [Clostridia bacterium]|nr:hypothetical protein [Clostridia bacterium]
MKERDRMIYKLMNMDAEGDRDESEAHHGGGNTRLPYGLCKALGIDTTGFSPKDCWKALKGEGVSPTEAYATLQKTGSAKEIVKEAKDRQILKEARGWQSKQFAEVDKKYPQAKRAIDHATQTFKSLKGSSGEKAVLMKNVKARLNNVLKEDLKQGGQEGSVTPGSNFEYMRKLRRDSVRKMVAHADVQYVYYQQKHLESQIKKDEASGIMTATVAEEKKQLKDFLDKNIKRIDKLYGEGKQDKFAPETYKLWHEKVRPAMMEGLERGKGTSASPEKKEIPKSATETSAKANTPASHPNTQTVTSKKQTKSLNALIRTADKKVGTNNKVLVDSEGKQFYSNGYMGVRFNSGVSVSDDPGKPTNNWQHMVYTIIDNTKGTARTELPITVDDLSKFVNSTKSKAKEEHKRAEYSDFGVFINGFSDVVETPSGKTRMAINAQMLLDTANQFENPKFYYANKIIELPWAKQPGQLRGIYIKGDNGEGVVLPARQAENSSLPYISKGSDVSAANSPKATTSGGGSKTEWA